MLPSVDLDDFFSILSAIQINRLADDTILEILQGIQNNSLRWTPEEQGTAFFWILRNAMREKNIAVLESALTVFKEIRKQEADSILKKTVETRLSVHFEDGLPELPSRLEERVNSHLHAVLLRYGPPQLINAEIFDIFLGGGEPEFIELLLERLALEKRLSKIVCPILDRDLDQEKMRMLQQGIKKVAIDKLSEEDLAALFVKLAEKQERQADFLNECLHLYFHDTSHDSCRLLVKIMKEYNSYSCFLLILNLLKNFNVKLYPPSREMSLGTFWSIGQTLFGRCLERMRADFETPLIAAFAMSRPLLLLMILLLHKKRQSEETVNPAIENQELEKCLGHIFHPSAYVQTVAFYERVEQMLGRGGMVDRACALPRQQLLLLISYYGEERILSLLSEEQKPQYDRLVAVTDGLDFRKVFEENFFHLEQDEQDRFKAQFDHVFESADWGNFVDLLAQIKRSSARIAPGG